MRAVLIFNALTDFVDFIPTMHNFASSAADIRGCHQTGSHEPILRTLGVFYFTGHGTDIITNCQVSRMPRFLVSVSCW